MKFYGNISRYVEYFDSFMVQKAIEEILDIISKANKYIDIVEPWKLFKEKEKNKEDLDIFIYTLSNKVFENLNLEISLKEDYAKILEGLNNKKIFIDIKIMPNNDSKPIFERLTEDTEEKIKRLF